MASPVSPIIMIEWEDTASIKVTECADETILVKSTQGGWEDLQKYRRRLDNEYITRQQR